MGAYVARRLLALLPTMLLASLIVFITIRLIPGDVIDLMLSQNDIAADKLSRDQLVAALGLDQPLGWQYLKWVLLEAVNQRDYPVITGVFLVALPSC